MLKDLFTNYLFISAVCGWLIAQICKIFTGMFKKEKFNFFRVLFSNGGMPSSHSATMLALTTASVLLYGFDSAAFAISAVVSVIVMNDAIGVRYETGEQAKILNRITRELFSGNSEEINTGLKELVGHTPFQVLIGALLGIVVAIGLGFLMRVI